MTSVNTTVSAATRTWTDTNGYSHSVEVNAAGAITDPGKYEGSPWWTPAADDLVLSGFAGETSLFDPGAEESECDIFDLGDGDDLRAAWGLPDDAVAIVLWLSPQGGVYGEAVTQERRNEIGKAYSL